jgi:hypothetical protein
MWSTDSPNEAMYRFSSMGMQRLARNESCSLTYGKRNMKAWNLDLMVGKHRTAMQPGGPMQGPKNGQMLSHARVE